MSSRRLTGHYYVPYNDNIDRVRGLPFMTSALRGEGVPSKADIVVSNLSKGGCMNLQTKGGGGKKIQNFCGRH